MQSLEWSAPFWGHVVSDDLVYWKWLPPALVPGWNSTLDFEGCWSGSVTMVDGVPHLLYTGKPVGLPLEVH